MPSSQAPSSRRTEDVLSALRDARERTLALAADVPDDQFHAVHSSLMSPLVWDLGHIGAFEDLWLVHRWAGEPMLREDLGHVYDAFETPRAHRGELEFLRRGEAGDYLEEVRERVEALTAERGTGDGLIHELVLQHELQHSETMLQALELARLDGYEPPPDTASTPDLGPDGGLELVDVPAGSFEMGAPGEGFAYDNERPHHRVELGPFQIGRTPVSNATWMTFAEGGGYERREWWSAEAWSWKQEYDISRPHNWTEDGREWRRGGYHAIDPGAPVLHVSWFEADAFARAHGVRLPTEAEWEKAATEAEWEKAATSDQLDGAGEAWEWTSSHFGGYPGFRAHPYREYSEVFFGTQYRVLRGGSWATSARVARPTFRNWDFPQRRQIFSGVRLASDAT